MAAQQVDVAELQPAARVEALLERAAKGELAALIIVGVYMFKNVAHIDFSRFETGLPAFLTIILMPLTYSISMGLAFGFVSFIVVTLAAGKVERIHPVMWGIGALAVLDIVLTAVV